MRIKCIACDALARPVYLAAARSPQLVDVTLQHFGLHLTPKKLRTSLQTEIDRAAEAGIYDAVVLAYGLCGKATEGLRATGVTLVLPRAHDCITLFLGSRRRYDAAFQACPGTYWYVQDFIERGESDEVPLSIGANTSGNADKVYADYVEKYGKDNADYLMEAMAAWQSHYERAAYIDTGLGEEDMAAQRARDDAVQNGWRFERLVGDLVLIKKLLDGDWDEDFLKLSPGQQVAFVGGEEIICAMPE